MKVTRKELFSSQDEVNWHRETVRIIEYIRANSIKFVTFDLFCGAGGFSKGADDARREDGSRMTMIAVGINHDRLAIAAHAVNFPDTVHLVEDIRDVRLAPLGKMARDIREACPHVRICMWVSAECIHHSRAKGGDSRNADSRSLPEEIYRYQEAIKPDLIQVENVTEFRSWGPLEQKVIDVKPLRLKEYKLKMETEYGILRARNAKTWIDWNTGLAFKKVKGGGVEPWMVPVQDRKAEFFNEWRDHLKSLGYKYEDRDLNAADYGARTFRVRYYGQFAIDMPIQWPEQTHAKDPEKHFKKTGVMLPKHLAVRPLLDFDDKGPSLFVPGRIDSPQTFRRVGEGGIKFIAGGKEAYKERRMLYDKWLNGWKVEPAADNQDGTGDFMIKFNSAVPSKDSYEHCVVDIDKPAPTVPTGHYVMKVDPEYLIKYNSHKPEDGCDANSVDEPSKTLTGKDKFAVAFVQQANNGFDPAGMNASVDKPARTITASGTQYVVQVEQILPFLSNYHGNGHNCHSVDAPSPTACAADIQAVVNPVPFIFRQFGKAGGGHIGDVDKPAGTLTNFPKMNIVSPDAWIMDTHYNNVGASVDGPATTQTASRHHSYIVNPSYGGNSHSTDKPCPVVVARQDKSPLHLAQVEYANETYYGIIIYKTEHPEIKELKYLMACYNIKDFKMRMLKEAELLQIQGLPKDFFDRVREMGVKISETAAKKYIGNSQEATLATAICESYQYTV